VTVAPPPSASDVAHGRRSVPNGVWGMLLLIATEAALLGTLVVTSFYLELRSPAWPPPGIEPPPLTAPLVLTGVLVLTIAPMLLAARAAGRGRRGAAVWLVALATVVQAGYLAWQIVLFVDDLDRFSADGTAYGSVHFTLLGAHHAHIAVGLLLNLWVLARLASGLTPYRVVTVRCVALYWAFVGVFAVLVAVAQVSAS
jgi:cytochrome c oxidase subunit 3